MADITRDDLRLRIGPLDFIPVSDPELLAAVRPLLAERLGVDELRELYALIEEWSRAYPLDVFPEPDHKVTGHTPTLCYAAMGRYMADMLMEKTHALRALLAVLDGKES